MDIPQEIPAAQRCSYTPRPPVHPLPRRGVITIAATGISINATIQWLLRRVTPWQTRR